MVICIGAIKFKSKKIKMSLFYNFEFDVWNLFVIWCLVLGIFTELYIHDVFIFINSKK